MNDPFNPGPQPPFGSPSPSAQPARVTPKRGMPGWLVVLLCTVGAIVVVGPIVIVLAIAGVRKYISNAKQAEARATVTELARRASAQFERVDTAGRHRMCPSASAPVPADIRLIANRKYQSSPSDWRVDAAANAGFSCLDSFWMGNPQYYSYNYEASPSEFAATAVGDLNGDGVTSSFVLTGRVDSAGRLVVAPTMSVTQPDE